MTLCGIGDAVQPFAATFAQALARGAISGPKARLFRGMRRHFLPTAGSAREGEGAGVWHKPCGALTAQDPLILASRKAKPVASLRAYWQASQKP